MNLKLSLAILILPICASAQIGSRYFAEYGVKGSTTIYDLNADKWYYTDSADAYQETLPASTFKILNSLIALDTKAVRDTNVVLTYDGKLKTFKGAPIAAWNRNANMRDAFKNSTIWFYVKMAEHIGLEKYQHYLFDVHYGNANIGNGKNNDFWNYGLFAISPVNQITFLRSLYKGELPFTKAAIDKVKDMLLVEQTPYYTLWGKTGWSYDGFDNGWWVGYLQTKGNTYFFTTRVKKELDDENEKFGASRMEITKKILKELEIADLP